MKLLLSIGGIVALAALGAGAFFFLTTQQEIEEGPDLATETQEATMEEKTKEPAQSEIISDILTTQDIQAITTTQEELQVTLTDLKAEIDPDHQDHEFIPAFYSIVFSSSSEKNITLNIIQFDHASRSFLHYDQIRRTTPGSEAMTPPIGELSAQTLYDPESGFGNIVQVKQGVFVFQLHTMTPDNEDALASLEQLQEVAQLLVQRLEDHEHSNS